MVEQWKRRVRQLKTEVEVLPVGFRVCNAAATCPGDEGLAFMLRTRQWRMATEPDR